MPDTHALLSASSAARWLNCPPSAVLAEQFPDTGSKYAAAGTLAHAIAELKARKYFLEPMGTRTYNTRMKKLKADPTFEPGMEAATEIYLDQLKSIAMSFSTPPFVALEVRVDYGHIAPEGFGTADCIMIGGDQLHVVDYKNGSGVLVEAAENPQMMLYALGALNVYRPIFGDSIREVHLHIVQPNAGGVRSWSLTTEELTAWGEKAKGPAALAFEGKGEFNPGPWCEDHFCPARAQCSARARKLLGLESDPKAYKEPELLSDAEIGDILERATGLQKWISDLQDYALRAALAGRTIPGYKAVEGRSSREWTSQEEAFAALQAKGVPEALLWERKPVTVAGLEAALGKKSFAEAAEGLVTKKPGKPTLVPESDKRPAYNAAAAAFGVVQDAGS
jgi:hypothetical protein